MFIGFSVYGKGSFILFRVFRVSWFWVFSVLWYCGFGIRIQGVDFEFWVILDPDYNYKKHIKTFTVNNNLLTNVHTDNFLIDMNGIFHYCCQKTYKYGIFKSNSNHGPIRKTNSLQKQKELFEMVGQYVDRLVKLVQPKKRIVLAIDGPAPISKQNQQRQRRYRSAKEKDDGAFDSNCITPGTKFLDHLGKYIDWFIRKQVSQSEWGDV